jgi:CBS domain-containing protein
MNTVGEILEERDAHAQSCALFYVRHGQSVLDVCRYMTERNVGAVCVFDGTRLVGLFSERDVVQRVIAKGRDPGQVMVDEVMTTGVVVAQPDEDYEVVLDRMRVANVRHLPVVSGEKLMGMLSMRDLLHAHERTREFELQALTDYVYHMPPAMQ